MVLRIPDNAREAFQFLALGVAVVLLVRLCMLLLANIGPDDGSEVAAACSPFQASYPLVGAQVLVTDTSELVPRLSSAGLFAILCGAVLGSLAWASAILLGRANGTVVLAAMRAGFLIGGCWALWCLLAGPARCTILHDNGLELRNADRFMGGIALPFTQERTWVPYSELERFEHRADPGSDNPCGGSHELLARSHDGGEYLLVEIPIRCGAEGSTSEAVAGIERAIPILEQLLDRKEPS